MPQDPDQAARPQSERDGVTTITKIQFLEAELSRLRQAMEQSGAAPSAQPGQQAPGPPTEANPDGANATAATAGPPPDRRPSRAHLDSALKAMSSKLRHVDRCALLLLLLVPLAAVTTARALTPLSLSRCCPHRTEEGTPRGSKARQAPSGNGMAELIRSGLERRFGATR